jgi:hypothetical protein
MLTDFIAWFIKYVANALAAFVLLVLIAAAFMFVRKVNHPEE